MSFGMDYDPSVGAVILFGGQDNIGAGPEAGCGTPVILNDTWQYSMIPSNNPQNTPSLPNTPFLMYGIFAGLAVTGGGAGAFFGWKRHNGKKRADSSLPASTVSCEDCGAVLPQGSAFCGKCGHQLKT